VVLFRAQSWVGGLRGIDRVRADQLIGLLVLIAIELEAWLGSPSDGRVPLAVAGVLLSAAVAVRRRWPLGGILVVLAAWTVGVVLGSRGGLQGAPLVVPIILLFYGLGAFAAERPSVSVLGLAVVLIAIDALMAGGRQASNLPATEILGLLVPYALGRMVRARATRELAYREESELLDAGRDLSARKAANEERARIARELHDVIAHSVSVMVIQAGGARLVMDSDPERAEGSLRSVERAGRDALAEMRRLLGVLDAHKDPRALAPQPGLADIRDLLSRARAAGLSTELEIDGQPVTVSPALDLCAYRIVQEALTNAIKHAGPANAEVHIRWGMGALELEVSDDGRGPEAVEGAPGGHGLVGMQERAVLHGGTIESGAGDGGGFTVRARLPLVREAL
jgi:signal transduction histidine kinase